MSVVTFYTYWSVVMGIALVVLTSFLWHNLKVLNFTLAMNKECRRIINRSRCPDQVLKELGEVKEKIREFGHPDDRFIKDFESVVDRSIGSYTRAKNVGDKINGRAS